MTNKWNVSSFQHITSNGCTKQTPDICLAGLILVFTHASGCAPKTILTYGGLLGVQLFTSLMPDQQRESTDGEETVQTSIRWP